MEYTKFIEKSFWLHEQFVFLDLLFLSVLFVVTVKYWQNVYVIYLSILKTIIFVAGVCDQLIDQFFLPEKYNL